jgi:hypothetical protein
VTPALLAALALAALPEGTVRYRAELGGEPLGLAELRVACAAGRCEVRQRVRLRRPVESGGGIEETEVLVEVDGEGRYRGGALRTARGTARSSPPGVVGAVPSALVEVVLAHVDVARGEACVPFFDEERPGGGRACVHRGEGGALEARVGAAPARLVPGEDGFPLEVLIAGRFRWIRDATAEVPAAAPRLAGTRVPGPADPGRARVFCAVQLDPPPPAPPRGLPPPRAPGGSCREQAAAWIDAARAAGREARAAVGVAWDGAGFVWHEWAEVRAGEAWLPVDPAFGQLPASGPRFTLARFTEGDPQSRDAAGARILACWSRSEHVTPR